MLLAAANGGFGMSTIVFFILIFGLMYFMMIRPQRKQQQKRQEMMNQLNVGDEVVTIGRLHGVVGSIDNEAKTVTLDCDGIYLVFDRMAIMRVEKKQNVAPASTTEPTNADITDTTDDEKSDSTTEEK
ncbi:preprotein translocase subunit YajC [Pediococcus acidilactici]|uniref:preprotein translocase subunit YajC n=1 Tax=Pediococcus acidilactici TaxID=1254 RepID=UPI0006B5980B|nr:preprotein translocase subunit YajC [Pediococcus acidilactici]KAF0371146.1 preprotein translocase subunit YajC [Pediococcus acidilactici]KAF0382396.1 preprotein translocase subunit YajC [Pediococcus acidilactici]KAF0455914.1 preprotein translocase subunit YajC [Pediococcus acidilactici]KAF0475717.1 preprotein translocase subunit YajC [Pediococcus acidilactici]KAF0535826.1 preprotein translocase subunit YajC [Pediococcus acidilactici]